MKHIRNVWIAGGAVMAAALVATPSWANLALAQKSACMACHGANGSSSYPQARSFSKDKLRFGNKPYDMWRTITDGGGLMAPQTWLTPTERYYVIQYIRFM